MSSFSYVLLPKTPKPHPDSGNSNNARFFRSIRIRGRIEPKHR